MTIKLIQGDCIEEMTKMQKESVDLTVTSPPYDNLRTYEGSLQWHEGIWKQVLEGLYRVTKKGGIVVWVVGDATIKGSETGTSFKQALYAKEIGFNLHDTMIFKKLNPMPLTHNRYEQAFEYMFIISKGKPKAWNPKLEDCKTRGEVRRGTQRHNLATLSRKHNDGLPVKRHKQCSNIWGYGLRYTKDHPAQFPEQLAHDHIISWSNEGDTVFDPFLGSGTTGVSAKKLRRNFIGIEKVEKYVNIAKERIGNDY